MTDEQIVAEVETLARGKGPSDIDALLSRLRMRMHDPRFENQRENLPKIIRGLEVKRQQAADVLEAVKGV